jgi:hypothetical protein
MPSTTAAKSPAAIIGIGHLWLNNGSSKQQCCTAENSSDRYRGWFRIFRTLASAGPTTF